MNTADLQFAPTSELLVTALAEHVGQATEQTRNPAWSPTTSRDPNGLGYTSSVSSSAEDSGYDSSARLDVGPVEITEGSAYPIFSSRRSAHESSASRTHQEKEIPVISFERIRKAAMYFSCRSGSTLHRAIATLFGASSRWSWLPRTFRLGLYMTQVYRNGGYSAIPCIPAKSLIGSPVQEANT